MTEEKVKKICREEDLDFVAVIGVKDEMAWVKFSGTDDVHISIATMSAMVALCDSLGITMQDWCDMALKLYNNRSIEPADAPTKKETTDILNNVFKEE